MTAEVPIGLDDAFDMVHPLGIAGWARWHVIAIDKDETGDLLSLQSVDAKYAVGVRRERMTALKNVARGEGVATKAKLAAHHALWLKRERIQEKLEAGSPRLRELAQEASDAHAKGDAAGVKSANAAWREAADALFKADPAWTAADKDMKEHCDEHDLALHHV